MRFPIAFACSLSLAQPAFADTLIVPDDAADLAAAVAMAQAGDTILVRTSADQNSQGPVVLNKSLTVVGDPVCNFNLTDHALILNGPANARLELENVFMSYESDPNPNANASLAGAGFEEVVLKNCEIIHDNLAVAAPIEVTSPAAFLPDVKRVVLLDSKLVGSAVGTDQECVVNLANFMDQAATGLSAPQADVFLLSSQVTGGRGGYTEKAVWPCPSDIAEWPGKGGVGLIAKSVAVTNSSVSSGPSAQWTTVFPNLCDDPATSCGAPFEAAALEVTGGVIDREVSLLGTPPSVSLSGGVQTLDIISEPQHAGSLYFVAGSVSGSAPGLPLGSLTVPLAVPDPYFDYSLANFNGAVLGSTLGTLDENGRAQATVTLSSALSPDLVGVSATHACLVFDSALAPTAVSNPTELLVAP